ncbi:WGxxGxxG family protein [Paenibacillus methanolicus]|uniref:MYXO-CTERM domain-containing protein n=1 Tax=Paenibacillus methanolicus TaxID=582686 RepID=A0A5S5C363_9BACL|nr:WGxxGxxG family protein [Paenibacillus methanolicus]TYP73747.1 MYXO-CTERM domain-containing protein [Paenibacillus methanolicus]
MKKQLVALSLLATLSLSGVSTVSADNMTDNNNVNQGRTQGYGANDTRMMNTYGNNGNNNLRAYAATDDDGFEWGWLGLLGLLGLAGMRAKDRHRDRERA